MRVIAHRGASANQPENTAAAFDAAVIAGAGGIELDLQFSRDGVVVVWHDRRLDRLGLPRLRVHGCDWAMLARQDAGRWFVGQATTHRPLRLETVLERWGRVVPLYLELKRYAGLVHHRCFVQQVVALLRRYGLNREVAILCFDPDTLRAVHQAAPELALVLNVQWPWGLRRVSGITDYCAAVCVNIARFQPVHVAAVHRLGLPLYTYTCDTAEQFWQAGQLGAAAVITNRPQAALESVRVAPDY